ncbi:MAG: argininosuccinate lyase [Eubacteriaceae bacterium]|nr:argininosuccinate lyase [Eubacteriaceae bacterium]
MKTNSGKLWAGRFSGENEKLTDEFDASIGFDKRLAPYDIEGSVAHVKMLCKQGFISAEDTEKIITALEQLRNELSSDDSMLMKGGYEDIHMAVEAIITDRIGEPGQRIHTGRSRNDQVALDMRMFVLDQCGILQNRLKALISVLLAKAEENADVVMPGFTHVQKAQAVTYGHYLNAYSEMFFRDISRIQDVAKRTDEMPLGAGALAASTLELDDDYVAELLGFKAVSKNSLDAVSDRDYCIELLSALSIVMMHLSRFCEEIVWWASEEFAYIKVSDGYSTGSSMMPQKRNPDVAELIRGKTGRVYGDLMAMLTVMKGIPMSYDKDIQEDKESVFDAVDTADICLTIFTGMVKDISVNEEKMNRAVEESFMDSTDAAEYLVRKGCPFRHAHFIIGGLVGLAEKQGIWLRDISEEDLKAACGEYYDPGIREAFNATGNLKNKHSALSPAPEKVRAYVKAAKEKLANL